MASSIIDMKGIVPGEKLVVLVHYQKAPEIRIFVYLLIFVFLINFNLNVRIRSCKS